jgi:hypothetical protein
MEALMEEEGPEGSEVSEHAVDAGGLDDSDEILDLSDDPDLDASDSDLDASEWVSHHDDSDDSDDSDDWGGSEGSGWFADPNVEGQERYFDGTEWTPDTRPTDPGAPVSHLPEHTGELQRAMAAATSDIDEVEDRLGTLFDRAEQQGKRGGRARKQAESDATGRRAGEDTAAADSAEQDQDWNEEDWLTEDAEDDFSAGGAGDDDDTLAALDEALASEEPEKVKKGLFRRRS